MAVDERARMELRQHLVEVLGPEPAHALMAQLPVLEWQELATKSDLASLEGRVDARFELFEQRSEARFELSEQRSDSRFDLLDQRSEARFAVIDERFAQADLALQNTKNEVIAVVRGELLAAVSNQTRMFLFAVLGRR